MKTILKIYALLLLNALCVIDAKADDIYYDNSLKYKSYSSSSSNYIFYMFSGINYRSCGTVKSGSEWEYRYDGTITTVKTRYQSEYFDISWITLPSSLEKLEQDAFYNAPELQYFNNFENTQVKKIPDYCFYECPNLQAINLPKVLEYLGERAFQNCKKLTTVTFNGNSCKTIKKYAFRDCGVTTLKLTEGIENIEEHAFYNCPIQNLSFPSSLKKIGSCAFYGMNTAKLTIPGTLTNIESYAFSGSSVKTLVIKDGVRYIGNGAFQDTYLTSVTLPKTLQNISDNLFAWGEFKTITIPDSVTSIGKESFIGGKLESIELSRNINSIGIDAFKNCEKLKTIKCYSLTPPTLGDGAFSGIASNAELWVPYGCADIYKNAKGWKDFPNIKEMFYSNEIRYATTTGSAITPYTTSVFGSTYKSSTYQDGTGLMTFSGNVTTVGNKAFYNITTLKWIELNNAVKSIGQYAFYGCSSLEYIKFNSTINSIGSYAFYGCENLQGIDFPQSQTTIYTYTFFNCKQLKEFQFSEKVTKIEKSAFSGCTSLSTLHFPSSVTSIGVNAFYNCNNLKSISVDATKPAACGANCFYGIDKNIPVYVPRGYVPVYEKADGWNYFTNICENIEWEKYSYTNQIKNIVGKLDSDYLKSQRDQFINEINSARTLDTVNEIFERAKMLLNFGVNCHNDASERFYRYGKKDGQESERNSLPTQGTSGNGVRIILHQQGKTDKVLELFNPSKIQLFRK